MAFIQLAVFGILSWIYAVYLAVIRIKQKNAAIIEGDKLSFFATPLFPYKITVNMSDIAGITVIYYAPGMKNLDIKTLETQKPPSEWIGYAGVLLKNDYDHAPKGSTCRAKKLRGNLFKLAAPTEFALEILKADRNVPVNIEIMLANKTGILNDYVFVNKFIKEPAMAKSRYNLLHLIDPDVPELKHIDWETELEQRNR